MRTLDKRHHILAAGLVIAFVAVIVVSQLVTTGTPPVSAAATANAAVVDQAMTEVRQSGVPVVSWQLDDTTLSVTLASKSTTDVGTPDDPINLCLAERGAYLARARGVVLSELKLEVSNANGKSLYSGSTTLDQTFDSSWTAQKSLPEVETLAAVKSGLAEKTDLSGLTVKQFDLGTNGAREIHFVATATDVKAANKSTADLVLGLYSLINNLNAGKQAQIALARVEISDESGQPLLNWIYDAQRGAQHWWQAPGMTTDWFETPGP